MKILFDLFPVILFFIVFKWGEKHPDAAQSFLQTYLDSFISGDSFPAQQAPIMLATLIAIMATLAQLCYLLVRRKKIDGMLWLSFLIVSLFGGMTLYFHDEAFIKWKPTILYWSYGLVLIVGQFVLHKNFTRSLLAALEKELTIPEPVWTKLNYLWMIFFIAMGGLNLLVAYHFSTDAWVDFKLFGSTSLMFLFLILQIIYLARSTKISKDTP
jgi:intracellular septation protein